MNEPPSTSANAVPDLETVRLQVQAHLRLLQQAGVEWLPKGRGEGSGLRLQAKPMTLVPSSPASTPEPPPLTPHSGESDLSLTKRRQALQVLAEEVRKCTRCPELAATRTQTVFADGGPGVELCFIGEAPGADEDAQGLPFVGAAGQLLNRIIAACGLTREEVYICNILKCRPPGNRTPQPNEAANCRPFLDRQIELVKPQFICALGGCAAQNLLETTIPIGRLRGRFHDYKGIPVMVTYHPAYLLPHRNPDKKKDVWEDMKMLLTKMGRPIPQKK